MARSWSFVEIMARSCRFITRSCWNHGKILKFCWNHGKILQIYNKILLKSWQDLTESWQDLVEIIARSWQDLVCIVVCIIFNIWLHTTSNLEQLVLGVHLNKYIKRIIVLRLNFRFIASLTPTVIFLQYRVNCLMIMFLTLLRSRGEW